MLVVQFTVTYLATDIGRTTARTMTDRWHDVTWRSFEVLTLLCPPAHGALALGAAARARSRALELACTCSWVDSASPWSRSPSTFR